jgi:hypothetical protein
MNAKLIVFILFALSAMPLRADVLKGEPSLQGYSVDTDGYLKATPSEADALNQKLDIWMTKQVRVCRLSNTKWK